MILFAFATFLCIITFYTLAGRSNHSRFTAHKSHWLIAGFSLFSVQFSISSPLLFSGIFHTEGLQGMWFLWSQFLVAGLVPFVFAPLWIKLNISTDNEFVLQRFSGKAANYLQLFRAFYVGLFICCLMLSFQILAFVKFMRAISSWSESAIFGAIFIFCLLLTFFNKLQQNIRIEFLQAILFFVVILIVIAHIYGKYDIPQAFDAVQKAAPDKIARSPEINLGFLVFVFIQAFFVQAFDGSGVEAQRFFANKSSQHVWKISVTAGVLITLFNYFIFLILITGIATFPSIDIADNEMKLIAYLQAFCSPATMALVTVLFTAVFISSFSGYLNWGASYLCIDVYDRYLKNKFKINSAKIGQIILLIMVVFSFSIAYFSEALEFIIKLLFNLSAGVAPVFVLRWFWMRINAWSQISAMISAVVYAAVYYLLLDGTALESSLAQYLACSNYAIKLYTLTLLTTATWLLVTYLSPADNEAKIHLFKQTVTQGFNLKKGLLHAICFGLLMLLFMLLLFEIFL